MSPSGAFENIGTVLMHSMPAATTTSLTPDMIDWAAKWMACWDEPHCRSTVVPGTLTGQPAASTTVRGRADPGARRQGGQRLARQFGRVPAGQRPAPLAGRRADGIHDYRVVH